MCSAPVIITKITRQNAAEVRLIEDDNVVKTLATDCMSIASVSVTWLCRKLRQVGEGVLGRRGRYLPTVA